MNTITKSECVPEKSESVSYKREINQAGEAPTGLGAPFQTDPAEAENIKELVTSALAELSQKPNSSKYG